MKIIMLIGLFLPAITYSALPTYVPKNELPVEFSYLINSLQLYPLQDKEREDLAKQIKTLDKMFAQMTKEEVYFTLKSEIYKDLLNKPKLRQQSQFYDRKILKKFIELIESRIESYHPFAQWIIFAIYSDLKQIFDSPYFNTFIVEKRGMGLKNPNAAMIEKKLNLILPWYEEIINQNPEEFHEMLKANMQIILEKISSKIRYLLRFSRLEKLNLVMDDKLEYFEIKKPEIKTPKKDPLMDIDLPKETPLEQANNQWVPRNEPMEPDPNYVAPDRLPIPSDDW